MTDIMKSTEKEILDQFKVSIAHKLMAVQVEAKLDTMLFLMIQEYSDQTHREQIMGSIEGAFKNYSKTIKDAYFKFEDTSDNPDAVKGLTGAVLDEAIKQSEDDLNENLNHIMNLAESYNPSVKTEDEAAL